MSPVHYRAHTCTYQTYKYTSIPHLFRSTFVTTGEEICFAAQEAEKCVHQLREEEKGAVINTISQITTMMIYT